VPLHAPFLHALAARLAPGARALTDLFAPPRCAACDEPTSEPGAAFCSACDAACAPIPPERLPGGLLLVPARAYAGPAGQAVRKLKYGHRPDLAGPLGRLVATALEDALTGPFDAIVPVPLHPQRLAERGYNQAALVASHAAGRLGSRARARALRRLRATTEQASLERAARRANVTGAFVARERLEGRRVVLLDDVVTTAATAMACVEALREARAEVLCIACVARSASSEPGRGGADAPRCPIVAPSAGT
jgi:ComF family protein